MQNNINEQISLVMSLKQQGMTPQQALQYLSKQNPHITEGIATLKNMAQGRDMKQFFTQLAMQNGMSEQNIQALYQMFGK